MKATGTFEVELAPLESHVEGSGDTTLGRSGTNRLRLEVSPGSGSGELQGLHGSMIIHIDEGKHSYELEYELP